METAATIAISREAARLAFLCSNGIGTLDDFGTSEDFELRLGMDSSTSLEQEKAELLAGIREEVRRHGAAVEGDWHESDLHLNVYRDVLAHLAGNRGVSEGSSSIRC